jgi:hypothetical protein
MPRQGEFSVVTSASATGPASGSPPSGVRARPDRTAIRRAPEALEANMLTHRLNRLANLLVGLRRRSTGELVSIVRERRYPPLLRVAALRWLVHLAPPDLTRGAPYGARRRSVRQHYGV